MSVMYGKGERASIRLRKRRAVWSNDSSISVRRANIEVHFFRGAFALFPREFRHTALVQSIGSLTYNSKFLITNKGLRVTPRPFAGLDSAHFLELNRNYSTHPYTGEEVKIDIRIQLHIAGVYSRIKSNYYAFCAFHE